MEEVDNIILHFLRQLNVNIGEEIKQLCELSVDTIMSAVSKCLSTINPSLTLPQKLPQGISHRIEVAAQLASMCKDMGYKNEVGYQTFLYYTESDLRKVFMFLIECLPTKGKPSTTYLEPCDKKSLLYRSISRKIEEELNSIWSPHCCNPCEKNIIGDFVLPEHTSHNINNDKKIDGEKLLQMLLEVKGANEEASVKTNTSNHIMSIENHEQLSTPQMDISTVKSLKELKEDVIIFRQKLNVLESKRNMANQEFEKIHKSCEVAEREFKAVQNILRNIDVSINDGEDILDKMKKIIHSLHSKSEGLTATNLSLKTEIENVKRNLPQSERSDCKRVLLSLKETAKVMKEEYSNKEELKEQLKKEFSKLNRGNKRATYTKRILEIISNVDKQNIEIKKILEDTRDLQKEINTLEGQLDRCFAVADETLFKDAKKDDQAKKAYKLLALLHSECNTIVTLVNDTGTLAREIVDLEDHVKTEKTKRTEDTLKRIQIDLSKMQEES